MLHKLLSLLLLLPALVSAGETTVRIGGAIDGKLVLPEGEAKAAVLLLHGWNSYMDEVGDMYAILSRELATRGIASLRINFNGEGRQNDYVVTMTYESRVSEALRSFDYLRQEVPVSKYGVVGFSLGGMTTLALLDHHADDVDSVVLWSAAANMRQGHMGSAYNNAVREAMLEGQSTYMDFTEITITREFLASFVGVSEGQSLAKYHGSLLTIRGDRDFLPSLDRQWLELAPGSDKQFLLIGDADHTFNVFDDAKPSVAAPVIEKSADWLERTLKED